MSKFCIEVNSILKQLQSGDKSKLSDLYDATFNHLKVIAFMYASDKKDYEDILSESYLRVLKYIENADTDKDGYNWLCKIVQNVAYDFSKKMGNNISLEGINVEKHSENVEDVLADKDMLLREIEKLTDDDRQILYLRFWQDYSFDEIAAELNRPKSSIHKRILILIEKINKNLHNR